jgi:hypothetical protein
MTGVGGNDTVSTPADQSSSVDIATARMRERGQQAASPSPDAVATPADAAGQTNAVMIICRAVSLSSVDPSANTTIAYALEDELRASPYFDPKATQLSGQITADDASGTFTFGVLVSLKNSLNF